MRRLLIPLLLFAALLSTALAAPTIFLVRHAEKATTGDLKNPDLSEVGRTRADALAAMLKDADITAVYVTELNRSRQTADPFARAAGLNPIVISARETGQLIAQLRKTKGHSLVVAHSNTIPEILRAFGLAEPPQINEPDFDNLFLIRLSSPVEILRLHFQSSTASLTSTPHDR